MAIDVQTLREFERELRESEAELSSAERAVTRLTPKVANLRLVVQGFRGLIPSPTEAADGAKSGGQPDRVIPKVIVEQRARATYGGRPSLPVVLLEVLSDGVARDLGQIYDAVCALPDFVDKPPSRGSVSNRLNSMARDGEIDRLARRRFRLAPGAGSENPDEHGGPNLMSQLDGEKSPGEQLAPAHPGHPYNVEGAPGVGTGPGFSSRGAVEA